MKAKYYILIIFLFSFFACQTKRIDTNIKESIQTETLLEESGQRETSSNVSGSMSEKTETRIDRTEHQAGGSVQLSAPDSTGSQYPVFINWYSNDISETSKLIADIKAQYESKYTELEKRFTDLQSRLEAHLKEKTVSKTGLTLLEKIGIYAIILCVLNFIYSLIKPQFKK